MICGDSLVETVSTFVQFIESDFAFDNKLVHSLSFQVLQPDVLYTVREGGELSEGETHWLTQNNPVLLPTGQAMMMTLDCGVLCGQVYDGLDSVGHCPHHSSR